MVDWQPYRNKPGSRFLGSNICMLLISWIWNSTKSSFPSTCFQQLHITSNKPEVNVRNNYAVRRFVKTAWYHNAQHLSCSWKHYIISAVHVCICDRHTPSITISGMTQGARRSPESNIASAPFNCDRLRSACAGSESIDAGRLSEAGPTTIDCALVSAVGKMHLNTFGEQYCSCWIV